MNGLYLVSGFWTNLIVTSVSSVECFINQKDLSQFPKFLSRCQRLSFSQRYKVLM